MEKMRNFFKDESGATMVEYGLMVALIAVVCIAAVTALGTNLMALTNASCSSPTAKLITQVFNLNWLSKNRERYNGDDPEFIPGYLWCYHGGVRPDDYLHRHGCFTAVQTLGSLSTTFTDLNRSGAKLSEALPLLTGKNQQVMARHKPLPGHGLTLTGGAAKPDKEVAMVKGGVTYSLSKAMIVALSMSLAVWALSLMARWT